jgi:hypothetical protein
MPAELYRYTFGPELPPEEAEATLVLALIAVEALHGESQARLDLAHYFDAEQTGRKAFLMELDPLCADVIVARYERFAGAKAQRAA